MEVNSAPSPAGLDGSKADPQLPMATNLLTESRPLNTSKIEDKPPQNDENGEGKSQKIDVPKPKIFDNKNFVEAPLPKTNPWGKSVAPVANSDAGKMLVLKRIPMSEVFALTDILLEIQLRSETGQNNFRTLFNQTLMGIAGLQHALFLLHCYLDLIASS